ncbi:MAG: hypothetical protein IJI84_04025 [Clostridia bacterium]|nr:hypothetical protein [Clostridia bacterium]
MNVFGKFKKILIGCFLLFFSFSQCSAITNIKSLDGVPLYCFNGSYLLHWQNRSAADCLEATIDPISNKISFLNSLVFDIRSLRKGTKSNKSLWEFDSKTNKSYGTASIQKNSILVNVETRKRSRFYEYNLVDNTFKIKKKENYEIIMQLDSKISLIQCIALALSNSMNVG